MTSDTQAMVSSNSNGFTGCFISFGGGVLSAFLLRLGKDIAGRDGIDVGGVDDGEISGGVEISSDPTRRGLVTVLELRISRQYKTEELSSLSVALVAESTHFTGGVYSCCP